MKPKETKQSSTYALPGGGWLHIDRQIIPIEIPNEPILPRRHVSPERQHARTESMIESMRASENDRIAHPASGSGNFLPDIYVTPPEVSKAPIGWLHRRHPEQPRAFGAFSERPVDTSAYTTPRPAPAPLAASFGGDADEAEAGEELRPVTDAASAVARLEAIYERDKEWFNSVPPRFPRQILDALIGGMRE